VIGGCLLFGGTGTIQLSVTDAPIVDDNSVTGVYVTFEEVQYNLNGEWRTMTGFDGPKTFDLLELTGGESALLGELTLQAGTYTQIRFIVAAEAEGSGPPSNTGTWINRDGNDEYDDGDDPLFVPSGAQTGYKATAGEPFTVPANGTVAITADFDLRRAVVEAGGRYILKPVVRLVVEDQAGSISGDVTNTTGNNLVVYAYEDGEFTASEAADPTTDDGTRFPNAVTSSKVEDVADGADYTLAFLAAGTYDLVIAQYDPSTGEYIDTSGNSVDHEDVEVTSGSVTTQDLSE
jgi:hypothetical protein